jgi:predicted anti-sigma-YlaC factor YlaD
MNCKQAHEIMNLVFDGETHALEASAREHMRDCAECRQWLAGMERVVGCMASVQERLPRMDIAAAVMSRLPDRHPASMPRRRVLVSRRALAWMCAGWAASFVVLSALGVIGLYWLSHSPLAGQQVVAAYAVMRAVADSAVAVVIALKPLGVAIAGVMRGYQPHAITLVKASGLLDCMILAMGYAIWRRRSRILGGMSIMI